MHTVRILSEAAWQFLWDAFENEGDDADTIQWKQSTKNLLRVLIENKMCVAEQFDEIKKIHMQLMSLQNTTHNL